MKHFSVLLSTLCFTGLLSVNAALTYPLVMWPKTGATSPSEALALTEQAEIVNVLTGETTNKKNVVVLLKEGLST